MIIASQKRKQNIAEYLLYMWQIEDLIRANGLDIAKIEHNIIDKYDVTPERRKELTDWYESLIDMMNREGVQQSGHLQMNKNVISQMAALHQKLLADPKFPEYSAEFYKTLPYIVELRSKAGEAKKGEIETCLTSLYGILLLRLQGKEIADDTMTAMQQIAKFVGLLSHYFKLDDEDKLFNQEDSKN